MDISEKHDRVYQYWKEHSDEIKAAERYDGSNYILKMLYKAYEFNSRASAQTVTCRTAHDAQVEHTRQRFLEFSSDSITAAICEVIDSDFERRLEEAEDGERYWRDEYYGDGE